MPEFTKLIERVKRVPFMNIKEEINRIDQRLEELRIDYRDASINRKRFILSGVKIMKDRRAQLVLRAENGV